MKWEEDLQTDKCWGRQMDKWTNWWEDIQTDGQFYEQTNEQTDKWTNRWEDKQKNGQKHEQTNNQTDCLVIWTNRQKDGRTSKIRTNTLMNKWQNGQNNNKQRGWWADRIDAITMDNINLLERWQIRRQTHRRTNGPNNNLTKEMSAAAPSIDVMAINEDNIYLFAQGN